MCICTYSFFINSFHCAKYHRSRLALYIDPGRFHKHGWYDILQPISIIFYRFIFLGVLSFFSVVYSIVVAVVVSLLLVVGFFFFFFTFS